MSYTNPNKIITSPLEAIKEMCIDCCGGEKSWVAECTAKECAVYEFRLGKKSISKKKRIY